MPDLLKSVEDGVMTLTLNRPDAMNALSRDMLGAFSESLEEVDEFPAHRRIEGVELVGPVESDGHHAVGQVGQQGLVFHGRFFLLHGFRSARRNAVARLSGLRNIRRNSPERQSRRTSCPIC